MRQEEEQMMKTLANGHQARAAHERKKAVSGGDYAANASRRIRELEEEVAKAKESESKMLESLVSLTKQLEEAKIEMEETKLDLRALREGSWQDQKTTPPPKPHQGSEEAARLRAELRSATEAEEKSKKAMDDLAAALKEVATENTQLKSLLSATQTEHLSARVEADHVMTLLKSAEARLEAEMEESRRLRMELEESAVAWRAKEGGLMDCLRVLEEEAARAKEESDQHFEAHKGSREEASKARDIMKQAVNEATVVKEALEIARAENSQLKDDLKEKELALRIMKQELECIKVTEAAAVSSVKKLEHMLAAASGLQLNDNNNTPAVVHHNPGVVNGTPRALALPRPAAMKQWQSEGDEESAQSGDDDDDEDDDELGVVAKENDVPGCQNPPIRRRRHHHSGPIPIGSMSFRAPKPEAVTSEKHRRFPSMGSLSLRRPLPARAVPAPDDGGLVTQSLDFDHTLSADGSAPLDDVLEAAPELEIDSPAAAHRRRRPVLRKFGDLLRRSLHYK